VLLFTSKLNREQNEERDLCIQERWKSMLDQKKITRARRYQRKQERNNVQCITDVWILGNEDGN
jgi:hypothetical protein